MLAIDQWNRKRSVQGLFIFAFWTFLGLSFAGQFFIASSQLNRPVSWQQALYHSLADWYVFALLSILPIGLARRYGFGDGRWLRNLGLHVGAGFLFSLAYVLLRTLAAQLIGWREGSMPGFGETFRPLLFKTWHFNVLIYWVILTVFHAVDFYRKYQERHNRSLQLENRLVEARLQALQMQMNPHFLYNTLHAISSLMYQDLNAADRMIARLSQLLRYALESTARQEVPLRQELEFLKNYLTIEQTRFGDRLRVTFEIEPETNDLLVPTLILQPFVENAIQHGIQLSPGVGNVVVAARKDQDVLILKVRNSSQSKPRLPFREGVGLTNSRERLEQLYGDRLKYDFQPLESGGLEVTIQIPRRAEANQEAD